MSQNRDSEKTVFKAPSGAYEITEPVKKKPAQASRVSSKKPLPPNRQESKKKKRKKSKKRRGWLFLLLLIIPIAAGILFYYGKQYIDDVIDIAVAETLDYYNGPKSTILTLEPHNYVVSSIDELLIYLTHPSLNEGDTIVINDDFMVDCNEAFDGYLMLGLINFDCKSGSITFTGGTVVMVSGREEAISLNGISFVDTHLFIDAASVDLTWREAPASALINTKTLNGSPSLIPNLSIPAPGCRMTVDVNLHNITSSDQKDIEIQLISPYFTFMGEPPVVSIPANGSMTLSVDTVIREGGRARIIAVGLDSDREKVIEGSSEFLELLGGGFYSGDPHTHTSASYTDRDGSTLEDNIFYAAQKGHSFIISVENDKFAQKLSQQEVDSIVGESDVFLQLTALETGRRNQLRHLMLYNYNSEVIPRSDYEVTYLRNYTLQHAIWKAMEEDPDTIVYLPHPFGYGLNIGDSLANLSSLYGITGIELIDQTAFSDFSEFRITLNVWNNLNIYDRQRVFGIGASNNIYSEYVGSRYTKGYMTELSEENIYKMLREGNMFASNGPELRFSLSDVKMGHDLYVGTDDIMLAKIYASSETPLKAVRVVRYDVDGKWEDLTPDYVLDLDFSHKNVYEYEAILPIEAPTNLDRSGNLVVQKSIYRLEVWSESSPYYPDKGMAFGNPIWVSADGERLGTSPAFTEIVYKETPPVIDILGFNLDIKFINDYIEKKFSEKMPDNLGGAVLYQLVNGDYYIKGDFTIYALHAYPKDDQLAVIGYHVYNSKCVPDKVTVVTSIPGQRLRDEITIYLLN